jgi:hypothetical protein
MHRFDENRRDPKRTKIRLAPARYLRKPRGFPTLGPTSEQSLDAEPRWKVV